MKTRIRSVVATFGWWQWLLAAVFVVALVGAGLFAVRTVRFAIYWRTHHNQPIERWMTLNYIAHSYTVPREVLEEALGLPPSTGLARPDRRPLAEIATSQGKTFDQLKATLLAAIDRARPPEPPKIGPAPPKEPPPPKGQEIERGAS